jgi:hypothetical protein
VVGVSGVHFKDPLISPSSRVFREESVYTNHSKFLFVVGRTEDAVYVRQAAISQLLHDRMAAPTVDKGSAEMAGSYQLLAQVHEVLRVARASVSRLLKSDVEWSWDGQAESAFLKIKESLLSAPILALPDGTRPYSVVCDASDFAIGCALLQVNERDHERVVSYQSGQLQAAEKNYPVQDKELLAMKYPLVKFCVHLLGALPFMVYTEHASLRTATQSPHMFKVEYKLGWLNVLADALSRRPD